MERNELLNELSKIIGVPVEKITGQEQLGTTPGWDSFAQVEIMLVLEKKFQIKIDEKSMNEFITLDRILKIVA